MVFVEEDKPVLLFQVNRTQEFYHTSTIVVLVENPSGTISSGNSFLGFHDLSDNKFCVNIVSSIAGDSSSQSCLVIKIPPC